MTPSCAHGMASCSSSARRPLCGRPHREPVEHTGLRSSTHYAASTSQCIATTSPGCRRQSACRPRQRVVTQALFDPPPFQPEKLAVLLAAGTTALEPAPPLSRKYTLTHNDITGNLRLTIGPDYNEQQISGFYTRLLRDEVVAEWVNIGSSGYALHVYCHVSGEERWLAPPLLRNYIFRREMPLVLDSLVYADRKLLAAQPELAQAQVYVHFQSTVKELDTVEYWGVLGDRSTWPRGPMSILLRMIYAVVGWPPSLSALPADLSIDLPTELRDVEEAVRQQQQQQQANLAELRLQVEVELERDRQQQQQQQQQRRQEQAARALGVQGWGQLDLQEQEQEQQRVELRQEAEELRLLVGMGAATSLAEADAAAGAATAGRVVRQPQEAAAVVPVAQDGAPTSSPPPEAAQPQWRRWRQDESEAVVVVAGAAATSRVGAVAAAAANGTGAISDRTRATMGSSVMGSGFGDDNGNGCCGGAAAGRSGGEAAAYAGGGARATGISACGAANEANGDSDPGGTDCNGCTGSSSGSSSNGGRNGGDPCGSNGAGHRASDEVRIREERVEVKVVAVSASAAGLAGSASADAAARRVPEPGTAAVVASYSSQSAFEVVRQPVVSSPGAVTGQCPGAADGGMPCNGDAGCTCDELHRSTGTGSVAAAEGGEGLERLPQPPPHRTTVAVGPSSGTELLAVPCAVPADLGLELAGSQSAARSSSSPSY